MVEIVGFTGTRNGMTSEQKQAVERFLREECARGVVHGDCVGVDADFDAIARSLLLRRTIRPGPDGELRAHCPSLGAIVMLPARHFVRNRAIVHDGDALLATPRLFIEETRGGTWYTINYARKSTKPVAIAWPDGRVTRERWGQR